MRLVFDRGTLLLLDPPPGLDGRRLEGAVFDARVGSWRAPAYRYVELHRALAAARVELLDEVEASWPRPRAWHEVDLRPYQQQALDAWVRGGRRGVVALPTGSGKTRVALGAMARLRLRTLCLAPTRALVEQWRRAIGRFYPGPVGCYGDGRRDERPVTVATFASAERHLARLGGRFDLLVVDEAHHVGGLAPAEALEMTVARARLGLTATPPAAGPARAELERLLGPVCFELGLADLAGSAVATLDRVVVEVDLTPAERAAYEAERTLWQPVLATVRRRLPGASWRQVLAEAAAGREGRAAVAAWHRARRLVARTAAKDRVVAELLERHREERVLVFTADNASACAIARRHLVAPITCDVGRGEREEVLERFRRGEVRALVSTRALNEGLDVADAEVAVLTGGGGGRDYLQRLGRILRPADGKRAVVYEVVARGTHETGQARLRRDGLAARAAGPG